MPLPGDVRVSEYTWQRLDLPGLAVHDIETHKNSANYDLSLYIANESEGLIAALEYNSDLFAAATIKRMLGHFETLLQAIATGLDHRVGELPILTEAERNVLLVDWNDTKSDYSDDKCLQHLIEAQVQRSPNAVAVVFEGRQLTYQELNSKANQLARHLRKLGVRPRSPDRDLHGALARNGDRAAWHPESRRRLYTAGSGLSDGPAGVHSSKFSGGGAIAPTFSA